MCREHKVNWQPWPSPEHKEVGQITGYGGPSGVIGMLALTNA